MELAPAVVSERPPFVAGVYDDMPGATYHAIEALSNSGAKKMIRSPQHFRLMRDTPNEPTDAMQLGTAVHTAVLEPDRLAATVVGVPADAPKRPTKAQRNAKRPAPDTVTAIDYWNAFDADNDGCIVLTATEFDAVKRMADAVRAHPMARDLLAGAIVEQSFFWNDAKYKVPCKARIDARNHGGLIDLKSTADASPEAFGRQAANLYYHMQAAFYDSAVLHTLNSGMEFFAFICIESEPPFAVAVYALPGNAVLAGARHCDVALSRYAAALSTGQWPGYSDRMELLTLPKWATTFRT